MTETPAADVNPYLDRVFGAWFKNLLLLILLMPTIFFIVWGIVKGWVGKDFGLQFFFLLAGIYLGKWFQNGKI